MEAIYYKEKDDDPSPFLDKDNGDDGEYGITTRVWPGGFTYINSTNLFTAN